MFKNGTEFCGEFPFDDYRVIILKVKINDNWCYEAWIRKENFCVMYCMFGITVSSFMSLDEFKRMILKNITEGIYVYEKRYVEVN